jgi:hypothetical protein
LELIAKTLENLKMECYRLSYENQIVVKSSPINTPASSGDVDEEGYWRAVAGLGKDKHGNRTVRGKTWVKGRNPLSQIKKNQLEKGET